MHSNYCIMLIIASALVTGFSGTLSHVMYKDITEKLMPGNVQLVQEVESLEKELAEKVRKNMDLAEERSVIHTKARKLASAVLETNRELTRLERQQGWFGLRNEFLGKNAQLLYARIGEIQDGIQEEISNVERTLKEMQRFYSQSGEEVKGKEDNLTQQDGDAIKKYLAELAILDQQVSELRNKLHRERQVVENRFSQPESIGRIVEIVPVEKKVVISLGKHDGIKQNFKFKVFGRTASGDQIDKGFIIIKDVSEAFSVGTVLYTPKKGDSVFAGDHIGSPAFRKDGFNIYLAGRFDTKHSSKYDKETLAARLGYMGNRILTDLDQRVDMVVEGELAGTEVSNAAEMGICIISEEQLVPYLGD